MTIGQRQRELLRPGRDAIWLTSASLVNQVSNFVFVLQLARSQSILDFGVSMTCIAIATFLAAIFDFGTNSKWFISLSSRALSYSHWKALLFSKLLASGFLSLVSFFFFVFSMRGFVGIFPIAWGVLFQQSVLVYLKSNNFNVKYSVLTAVEKPFALAGFVFLQYFSLAEVDSFWIALTFGTFATGTVGCIVAFHTEKPDVQEKCLPWLRNPWRGSAPFAVTSLVGATRNLDVLLVTAVAGLYYGGIYSSVSRWFQPVLVSAGISSTIIVPWAASKKKLGGRELFKALSPVLLAIIPIAVVAFYPSEVVSIFLGERYQLASTILPVLGMSALLSAASLLSLNLTQAIGSATLAAKASFLQFAFQFAGGFISLRYFGLYGFASTTFLSYCAALAYLFSQKTKY
jgi:O-antigen/teichoic acid export membrane protein